MAAMSQKKERTVIDQWLLEESQNREIVQSGERPGMNSPRKYEYEEEEEEEQEYE
jgi:hypothetical protein